MKRFPWLLAATLLLMVTPSQAHERRHCEDPLGLVRAAVFEEVDVDDDGALTLGEFEAFRWLLAQRLTELRFARLDEDGDDLVSSEEMVAAHEHHCRRRRPRH